MQVKRIKCPQCSTVMDVKNSKEETAKTIKCPKCQTTLIVKFNPVIDTPIEAHTFIAPPPKQPLANDGATQLAGNQNGATQLSNANGGDTQLVTPHITKSASAKLVYNGICYTLRNGRNIVGRKATTSSADVQIDTQDRYMSRQHCMITVTALADGSLKAVLKNYQNKNATTVDGLELAEDDEIRLNDGNSITLGRTTITFKNS